MDEENQPEVVPALPRIRRMRCTHRVRERALYGITDGPARVGVQHSGRDSPERGGAGATSGHRDSRTAEAARPV